MRVNSPDDLKGLIKVGRAVAKTIMEMKHSARPGMTTKELDDIGAEVLSRWGAESAAKSDYQFPGHTCISVNHEVAHGIPGDRVLQQGDLINIDVSAKRDGYYADAGHSFQLPPYRAQISSLCRRTQLIMLQIIHQLHAGMPLNQIGKMLELEAKKAQLKVIRNLCSHGVGRALHEEPKEIVHFYDANDTRTLELGQVITIEPFLSTGSELVYQQLDGWTLAVPEDSYAAQHEHTVVITEKKPIILTNFFHAKKNFQFTGKYQSG